MGALEYAKHIERLLNTCDYLDPRDQFPPKMEIPPDNPLAFSWVKVQLYFQDDKVLKVHDQALFDNDGAMAERSFSYDFRTKGAEHPIFRICNHEGLPQSIEARCHVHVEDLKDKKTGESRLECFSDSIGFPSNKGKDFAYAIHCIKNFYLGKPQEWENGTANDPCV